MIINSSNLQSIFTGYAGAFAKGQAMTEKQYEKVSMNIASNTAANIYPWLGDLPSLREWVGDKVIKNLKVHDYTIKNKDFEVTVAVRRNDIEDDQFSVYSPLFEDLGNQSTIHPNQLVFNQLKHGHSRPCYDGCSFFASDHPVGETTISNNLEPENNAGAAWYLLCTTRAVKPIVLQKRKEYELKSLDRAEDDNVFLRGEYLYGVEARVNVGYGLWQTAIRSTHPLTAANYVTARSAMLSLSNDEGAALGLVPNILVVPPSLEGDARKLVVGALASGGATNEWAGSAELLVSPWL